MVLGSACTKLNCDNVIRILMSTRATFMSKCCTAPFAEWRRRQPRLAASADKCLSGRYRRRSPRSDITCKLHCYQLRLREEEQQDQLDLTGERVSDVLASGADLERKGCP